VRAWFDSVTCLFPAISVRFVSLFVFALGSSPRAPHRYNFVTPEQFKAFSDKGSMLEFGERNGVYYGTLKVSDEELVQYKAAKANSAQPQPTPAPAAAAPPKEVEGPTMWDESIEL
jgi:hypothetical protein